MKAEFPEGDFYNASNPINNDFPVEQEGEEALSILHVGHFQSMRYDIAHSLKSTVRKLLKTWENSVGGTFYHMSEQPCISLKDLFG